MLGKRWRRYDSLSISERYTAVRTKPARVTVTVPPNPQTGKVFGGAQSAEHQGAEPLESVDHEWRHQIRIMTGYGIFASQLGEALPLPIRVYAIALGSDTI